MKRNLNSLVHVITVVLLMTLAGCFPEETLEWSGDGSVGLACGGGAVYLVDGTTGQTTLIDGDDVTPWPGISDDGQWIAFTEERQAQSLQAGLDILPIGERALIQHEAEVMKTIILQAENTMAQFPSVETEKPQDNYVAWVHRYLCEHADEAVTSKLNKSLIQEGMGATLSYYVLQMAPRENPNQKSVLATSLRTLYRPRFSPENKAVAYLMGTINKEDFAHDLMLAVPDKSISAALVGENVAWGFDWGDDGKNLAYIEGENKSNGEGFIPLGLLTERSIYNDLGELQVHESSPGQSGGFYGHTCEIAPEQLAGVMHNSMSMVEYGLEGRIFFSSMSFHLPATQKNEFNWDLYCYDPITKTVTNVLPAVVRNYVTVRHERSDQESMHLIFTLSPDKRSLLLGANRFAVYQVGADTATYPVEDSYAAAPGTEEYDLLPAWKGNNQISCKVPPSSPLLPQGDYKDSQVIVINTAGIFESVINPPAQNTPPGDK